MVTLPASGFFQDPELSTASLLAALDTLRNCIAQVPGTRTAEEATIANYILASTEPVRWIPALKGSGEGGTVVETISADLPAGALLLVENPLDRVDSIALKRNPAVNGGLDLRDLDAGQTLTLEPGDWALLCRRASGGTVTWYELFRRTKATHHRHEIYEPPQSGQEPDGNRTVFDTARPYHGGSLELFYNNVQQRPGVDYTEDPTGAKLTTAFTPEAGSWLYWKYRY
jgi:hypothetical protein